MNQKSCGVGKTEHTKIRYLAYVGGRVKNAEEQGVVQKILESNPVLEIFGNGKTVRDNSSRFGKLIKIQLDQRGECGVAILHLGYIEFAKGQETDAFEPKDDKSWVHLFTCAEKTLEESP
ncbi:hypothetical protein Goari_027421 [Gossypium aridum]|uniref:Myosin motor domain-containing protein n=1 Tax=Gossypium aridum TaxID=34290 RepID=A0A7J8YNH8_GOSAI|nr:hypothetical protein [Gossypium aridum]